MRHAAETKSIKTKLVIVYFKREGMIAWAHSSLSFGAMTSSFVLVHLFLLRKRHFSIQRWSEFMTISLIISKKKKDLLKQNCYSFPQSWVSYEPSDYSFSFEVNDNQFCFDRFYSCQWLMKFFPWSNALMIWIYDIITDSVPYYSYARLRLTATMSRQTLGNRITSLI